MWHVSGKSFVQESTSLITGGALPGRRPQVCRALPRSPPGTAASPEPGHAVSARGKGHGAPLARTGIATLKTACEIAKRNRHATQKKTITFFLKEATGLNFVVMK